jgi:hypothetical protein
MSESDTDMDAPRHGSKHLLDYLTAIFAFLAAIAGTSAAFFVGRQASLTRQSLEITNRAFVSVDVEGSEPALIVNDPLPGRAFKFNLDNKGYANQKFDC